MVLLERWMLIKFESVYFLNKHYKKKIQTKIMVALENG